MNETLRAVDIIAAKRDSKPLSREQIQYFIQGYATGDIPDYQAAALCMAILLKGMSAEETGHLTRAMIDSGEVISLERIAAPLVDKHSTGGVGDKISLILAPMAAACGLKVPMMSGRALGHTGGTLDKLESIPGYSTALSPARFRDGVEKIGFVMSGQSEEVVPADRKLYALRDVSATVESIPLITASILSKKFAEGAQALVMDVKCGQGAFMKTEEEARALALSLVDTGKSLERRVVAVLTDMAEPLGFTVGNFLEVEESIACLQNEGPADVMEISYRLGAWMLIVGGLEKNLQLAEERCRGAIESGSAFEIFKANVEFQGGDFSKLMARRGRARAKYSKELLAPQSGYLSGIDAFEVGMAAVALGVGRNLAVDTVEPLAGIELLRKTGDEIEKNQPLMRVWAEEESRLDIGFSKLHEALDIATERPLKPRGLILEEITG